jgi:hypothetical protein
MLNKITFIRPANYNKNIEDQKGVFLAGPIQGTGNWQEKAEEIFLKLNLANQPKQKEFFIANPRAIETAKHHEFNYAEQVDWETKYLDLCSANNGVILFWLANETNHFCDRSYAQTTRYELAEWLTKQKTHNTKMVVGFDTKYSGSRYIKHRNKENSHLLFASSLEEACKKAFSLLDFDKNTKIYYNTPGGKNSQRNNSRKSHVDEKNMQLSTNIVEEKESEIISDQKDDITNQKLFEQIKLDLLKATKKISDLNAELEKSRFEFQQLRTEINNMRNFGI